MTMAKIKLTGKQLRAIGFPQGPVISIIMNIIKKNYKHHTEEQALDILKNILSSPADYVNDEIFGMIAKQLIPKTVPLEEPGEVLLNETGIPFNVFGAEQIEQGALRQMNIAARLPIAVAAALMPDAHSGYGLPIGGVLATTNAVIPYGVGVDIGCRMCLSIFDIDPNELTTRENYFAREINEATLFGAGAQFKSEKLSEHEVTERKLFDELSVLKTLQDRARLQLGSSGSGNHFVEFGIVEIEENDEVLNIAPGKYIGLLSHSGSRALGANIANHYTKLAKQKRKLAGEAGNLAWLSLDEEEGVEYWLAMNLAGDYASANHHIIHKRIARQLGRQPMKMVENHHNFAWKETIDDKQVIVHRKGATPAGKDVLGIIPGSMTAHGFIVKGKGEQASLSSAAHGAGRKMSRTVALKSITQNALTDELAKHGVKLLGGGLDEAPFAYKNIEGVMKSQKHLVDIIGRFIPKIVKMDGAAPRHWRSRNHRLDAPDAIVEE
jgi:tRNA-splicing ligase RtcB